MDELSPRQQNVLDAIVGTIRDQGRFPSVREIGKALGIRSPATISQHLRALLRKGCLERSGRHYVVADRFRRAVSDGIPVLGRVAAGPPVDTAADVEEWLEMDGLTGGRDRGTFAVKVLGDSMVEAGILEGDYVLVNPREEAFNGSIVVASLGSQHEVTVKYFHRKPEGVELRPANPLYEPIEVPRGDEDFYLAGRVVGLVRRF
jgi:repressor LexA